MMLQSSVQCTSVNLGRLRNVVTLVVRGTLFNRKSVPEWTIERKFAIGWKWMVFINAKDNVDSTGDFFKAG